MPKGVTAWEKEPRRLMRSFVIRVFLVGFALGMGIGEIRFDHFHIVWAGNANSCESVVGRRRVFANRSIYGPGRQGLLAQDTIVGEFVPRGRTVPGPLCAVLGTCRGSASPVSKPGDSNQPEPQSAIEGFQVLNFSQVPSVRFMAVRPKR